jgi:hypothetical protein
LVFIKGKKNNPFQTIRKGDKKLSRGIPGLKFRSPLVHTPIEIPFGLGFFSPRRKKINKFDIFRTMILRTFFTRYGFMPFFFKPKIKLWKGSPHEKFKLPKHPFGIGPDDPIRTPSGR